MALLTAQAWFDGSAEPTNPGPAIAGAYIEIEGRKPVHLYRRLGIQTNNTAEFEALILALEYCIDEGVDILTLRGDSKMVVNQAASRWKCKKPHLKALKARSDLLVPHFKAIAFEWVPREHNTLADMASRGHGIECVVAAQS